MFWDMAADSGMGFHQGGSSLYHHHSMLSFQSNPPDSAPAPAPPPAPPNAPALQGAPAQTNFKFVTGAPSDWTEYELAIFKEGLIRFSSNPSLSSLLYYRATTALLVVIEKTRYAREPTIMKYIKIAAMLPTRTIRDVALRCQWAAVSSPCLLQVKSSVCNC
jgi:hypothetical protein